MKRSIVIVHAYGDEIEVVKVPDRNASQGYIYLCEHRDSEVRGFMLTFKDVERKLDYWKRKYANLLKGLNYWKSLAETNKK